MYSLLIYQAYSFSMQASIQRCSLLIYQAYSFAIQASIQRCSLLSCSCSLLIYHAYSFAIHVLYMYMYAAPSVTVGASVSVQ